MSHEEGCKNTVASSCPGLTPWVFVHAALVSTQIAGLRTGRLHEVKHDLAAHPPVPRVLLADDDVPVKRAPTVGFPFPAQLALVLAFARPFAPLREPRLLFQGIVGVFHHFVGTANHQEFLGLVKTAGNKMSLWS